MTFADAVVERRGAHGAAPLVVLLHGRGSSEQDFVGLADHLPQGLEYAAVRAPIAESGAVVTAHRDAGGHGLSPGTVTALADWLTRVAGPRPV